MKIISVLLGLWLATFGIPVHADSQVPDRFQHEGWWDVRQPSFGAYGHYAYQDFPITCMKSSDADLNAIQFVWAYPDDQADILKRPKVREQFRKGIAAMDSMYAASAQLVLGPGGASLRNDYSLRMVTTQPDAKGRCWPKVLHRSYPSALHTWDGVLGYFAATGLYQDEHRRFVILDQGGDDVNGLGGLSNVGIWNDPDPDTNPNNHGWSGNPSDQGYGVWVDVHGELTTSWSNSNWWSTAGHEIGHALGAVPGKAPHTDGTGHATDCNDLMCTNGLAHATFGNGCGAYGTLDLETKWFYRLDCNQDDYYNLTHPDWESQWWNMGRSSFLWGNPQPAPQPAP